MSQRRRVGPQFSPAGLACRNCGCRHWLVVYTRPGPMGSIRRRRQCRHCGLRVTTIEREADDGNPGA